MSVTWDDGDMPPPARYSFCDMLRIVRRGLPLAVVVFGGLIVMLIVRLIERPLCGQSRPVTPYITQGVCRAAFVILGLPLTVAGPRINGPGAVVANHSSWLDIFALNARKNVYFVSKSEVAGWPGIGWLARATGTLFIRRNPREALAQNRAFEERLLLGHRLLFFPEGTSTDGLRVLPFKSTLFAAFFAETLRHRIQIQPVSVIYHAPAGTDPRFYGWWGDMSFGAHLVKILAARRQGRIDIHYHAPERVDAFSDRKALARALEQVVRAAHTIQVSDH